MAPHSFSALSLLRTHPWCTPFRAGTHIHMPRSWMHRKAHQCNRSLRAARLEDTLCSEGESGSATPGKGSIGLIKGRLAVCFHTVGRERERRNDLSLRRSRRQDRRGIALQSGVVRPSGAALSRLVIEKLDDQIKTMRIRHLQAQLYDLIDDWRWVNELCDSLASVRSVLGANRHDELGDLPIIHAEEDLLFGVVQSEPKAVEGCGIQSDRFRRGRLIRRNGRLGVPIVGCWGAVARAVPRYRRGRTAQGALAARLATRRRRGALQEFKFDVALFDPVANGDDAPSSGAEMRGSMPLGRLRPENAPQSICRAGLPADRAGAGGSELDIQLPEQFSNVPSAPRAAEFCAPEALPSSPTAGTCAMSRRRETQVRATEQQRGACTAMSRIGVGKRDHRRARVSCEVTRPPLAVDPQ
jgi:hypothetical protein